MKESLNCFESGYWRREHSIRPRKCIGGAFLTADFTCEAQCPDGFYPRTDIGFVEGILEVLGTN